MGQPNSKTSANLPFDQIKSIRPSPEHLKKNGAASPPVSADRSVQFVENLLLCWLDASAHKETNKRTLSHFYRVTHIVQIFTELDKCLAFLQSLSEVKVLFIVSGSFGPQILPSIANLEQIYSIYIFCGNKANHLVWTKAYEKIKGVHTQIKDLAESLRYDANQYDKSVSPFTILPPGPIQGIDQTNASFLYFQIFKSLILEMTYEKKLRQESVQYCQEFYASNEQQSNIINTFEDNYHIHSPIWWLTRKCFIYYMLRRAFSTFNYQLLHKVAFFIRDLHRDIKKAHFQSHHHQYSPIIVYRSARATLEQYRNLEQNNDGLIAINDFILTTLERSIALKFAQKLRNNVDCIAIIFRIHIDPMQTSMPFIALDNLKYLSDTNGEILLSVDNIFRIDVIEKVSDRLFEISLVPATKKDEQIVKLTNFIQHVTQGPSVDYKLGKFLFEVKQYELVEQIYKRLITQTDEKQLEERAFLLHELAHVYGVKGNTEQAIAFYQQALDLYGKYLPPTHPILFSTYVSLAAALQKQGDLSKAYEQCQRALKCSEVSEANAALAHNTEALILQQQRKFSEAKQILKKAIVLSPEHSSAAETYHDLANLYYQRGEYAKARDSYEKAIEIEKKFNSNSLSVTYFNLATAYEHLGDGRKAIECAEQSAEKARAVHGSQHHETSENLHYLQSLQSRFAPPLEGS